MRIVTMSREFGSGGRELGKRLAEHLGFDYYDRQIIEEIATRCDVDTDYAKYVLRHEFAGSADITVQQSFHMPSVMQMTQVDLLRTQTEIIQDIAKKGRDFVIVGRNADVLLEEYDPLKIFVCANKDFKLNRCLHRGDPNEQITEKEILKKMKKIDKNRKKMRSMITDTVWGDVNTYNIVINTSGWEIKEMIPCVSDFVTKWFETHHTKESEKTE